MTTITTPAIPLSGVIVGLNASSECGYYWHGRVELLDQLFHVDLVRVVDDPAGFRDLPAHASDGAHEIWDAMQTYYPDARFATVEIPGLDGQFVMFIHPVNQQKR